MDGPILFYTWAVLTVPSGLSKESHGVESGHVIGNMDSVGRGNVLIFHCAHVCKNKFSKRIFLISIHYFQNNIIWTWQYSAINNSKQLWLTAQDLHKINPVSIPAWLKEGAQCYPILTESLFALDRYYERKIFISLCMYSSEMFQCT